MANETMRALVIGAHPDDSEFGAGGTIGKLARDGWNITYIVCTNGNKGSHDPDVSTYQLSEIRETEQRAAANALGVQQVLFLRYNDGELEPTPALRAEIALYIRHFKPHSVFTHDPWKHYMFHPDHRTVGFATIEGVVSARDHLFMPGLGQIGITVWRPQGLFLWTAEQPDHIEDISETIDLKIASLREHHSQLNHVEGWEERIRKRAAETGTEAGFAAGEAFRKMPV
ncbi:MAG: PIG-L family deacetylase [Chloroflexi bacterium AL-W]|nr:PIG-L family deacetylase [Chloroflexi bacterium AL-N1]NOK69021.1 PIG-L family deacetylase [Chloroflexi bacterium AL-N10]NOK77004.1 PIG-L family deacetylase [Chloroflexi bacterium AL-N5]NOK82608.1 PIG-L family deacetylase [Chloroflexi bacterium AL-W]NOK90861.1 PIG-L family deacetylase [Chloroflexi bacterium AL-N15]